MAGHHKYTKSVASVFTGIQMNTTTARLASEKDYESRSLGEVHWATVSIQDDQTTGV